MSAQKICILVQLLETEPTIHEFATKQTNEERVAMINELNSQARAAMIYVLQKTDMIETACHDYLQYSIPDDDSPDNEMLAYYMQEGCISYNWCLRVFHDEDGNFLYDFNGWPGDNEDGGGVLFNGYEFEFVFVNGDADLCAIHPMNIEVVESYCQRRMIHRTAT